MKKQKQKLKAGQKLVSVNIEDATSCRPQTATPVEIVKIGRKYFTISYGGRFPILQQHHIKDWEEKTEYSPTSRLYLSEKEWLDEKNKLSLLKEAYTFIKYSPNYDELTLDQARRICDIIKEQE